MEHLKIVHTSFIVNFSFTNNVTILTGAAGAGKSMVFSFIREHAAINEQLACINHLNYEEDIAKTDEVMDKYKDGYEVTSFAAESFPGGVNGSLRKGDIVNLYALDPATELLTLMAENVYVANVYDSSGNKISEPEEIATSFTVYVTKDEVEQINLAVVYGGVQMYLIAE